jgi:tryptophan synthase alpha chain
MAMSSSFFTQPRPGRPGLALFLNAGDPPFDVFKDLILMLDAERVDCLELAVPFPKSPTDGPVIRASADRALADGVDLDAVLGFVHDVRPELSHLKIALLADWSHSIKGTPMREFLARVRSAGADGLLVHGLPPRLRQEYWEAAEQTGQPDRRTPGPQHAGACDGGAARAHRRPDRRRVRRQERQRHRRARSGRRRRGNRRQQLRRARHERPR